MDKNTLVGFALIGAVVIGFSIYNRPSQEEMARAKHYQDSIQAIAQKEAERLAQAATAQSQNATLHLDSTSMFYGANQGTEQLTTLENNVVKLTFTNKGGRVCAAILKDYNGQDGKPLMLFDEKDSGMNFAFEGKNENILTEDMYFQPTNVTDSTVTMRLAANNGGYIDFDYKLLPDAYMVNFTIRANGMQNFFPPALNTVNINWRQRARQLEKGFSFEQRYTSLTYKPVEKSSDYLNEMKEAKEDVQKLLSYEEDQIGSCMTNNYIVVRNDVTIREAMSTLVKQAGEHDNIQTLYVIDENGIFAGAIDLKDLIIAREHDNLQDIISSSYPYVYEHEKISECMEILTDYEEDSIPVLTQDKKIAGILTSSDIVELVDDEMGDDYAKLAGLTEEEDLNEPTIVSMKKRLPWLIALLFLGMAVSSVVGMFESIVAVLPIVICFQSLVLDMAGNVGTQSLAVTIRVLMDENLSGKKKIALLFKEMKIGFLNGASLAIMALVFLGVYIHLFKHYAWISSFLISGCVGISLIVAMVISSLVGTIIPMFFHKINIDPAVASGPLITTINDLVAVITYYGLSGLVLIQLFHI